jgi:vacuolar iron transporter family protein
MTPSISQSFQLLTPNSGRAAKGSEQHFSGRSSWLRAGVLGANDGLISTSSLVAGVAAANVGRHALVVAGIAGLTAGAFSMAAGEYVSVSSQRDSELADLRIERNEHAADPARELAELSALYEQRGLDPALSRSVAEQLSAKDPVLAHARDELGLDDQRLANPWQAAIVSAISFSIGAIVPVVVVLAVSGKSRIPIVVGATLAGLVLLGSVSARLGGASVLRACVRVVIGGSLALAASLLIGKLTTGI